MDTEQLFRFEVHAEPFAVNIVGSEIVLDGFTSVSPTLSAKAAREMGRLLIQAANMVERR